MFRRRDPRLRPPPTAASTALSARGRPRRAGRRAAGTSCVMSSTRTNGAIRAMTPWQARDEAIAAAVVREQPDPCVRGVRAVIHGRNLPRTTRLAAKPPGRILKLPVDQNLEMQVRPGGQAGRADLPDDLPGRHGVTRTDQGGRQMGVTSGDPLAMGDRDQVSICRIAADLDDGSACRCVGQPVAVLEVDPAVQLVAARDRVAARAEGARDSAVTRPNQPRCRCPTMRPTLRPPDSPPPSSRRRSAPQLGPRSALLRPRSGRARALDTSSAAARCSRIAAARASRRSCSAPPGTGVEPGPGRVRADRRPPRADPAPWRRERHDPGDFCGHVGCPRGHVQQPTPSPETLVDSLVDQRTELGQLWPEPRPTCAQRCRAGRCCLLRLAPLRPSTGLPSPGRRSPPAPPMRQPRSSPGRQRLGRGDAAAGSCRCESDPGGAEKTQGCPGGMCHGGHEDPSVGDMGKGARARGPRNGGAGLTSREVPSDCWVTTARNFVFRPNG